jgi:hypothetical protein
MFLSLLSFLFDFGETPIAHFAQQSFRKGVFPNGKALFIEPLLKRNHTKSFCYLLPFG